MVLKNLVKQILDQQTQFDYHNHEMWDIKPEFRWTFNKLELGYRLGYDVGPVPLLPKASGYYCIRPIYNLTGLGLYARKMYIDVNDENCLFELHPSEFWTEWWTGTHYSIDYIWDNGWQPVHAAIGTNNENNLLKFESWHKVNPPSFDLPDFLDELKERAKQTMHSTAKEAATIAKKAKVKRLIIGHYSQRYFDLTPLQDEAQSVFPNTLLAHEGETHEVKRTYDSDS